MQLGKRTVLFLELTISTTLTTITIIYLYFRELTMYDHQKFLGKFLKDFNSEGVKNGSKNDDLQKYSTV